MIITIFLALAAILAVFVLIVAMRPGNFRIAGGTNISAPPAIVFAHVNDLHRFQDWSPWAKQDPHALTTLKGHARATAPPSPGAGRRLARDA